MKASFAMNVRAPGRGLTLLWVVLEALLATGAVLGGLALLADPSGRALGLPPPSAMLRHTPFHDYFWPGLILLLANGLLPVAAIALNLAHRRTSALANLLVGVVLTGWMVGQLLLIGYTFFLQIVLLAYGLALLTLWVASRSRGDDA